MNTSLTSRLKQRAVIEFLTNEGCVPKEIHARLMVQFQEKTIDISNVRRCAALAKKSEPSELRISDEFRSGRPKTAKTNDNIAKVESMIRDDRRITQNQIAIALDISQGAVSTIIQNLHTAVARQKPKSSASNLKLFYTLHTVQTWPQVIFFCFPS